MSSPDEVLQEMNRSLRATTRDLVALSALPATWINLGLPEIARSLADVLTGTLPLDFVYVRLANLTGEDIAEVVRSCESGPSNDEAIRRAIAELLHTHGAPRRTTVEHPSSGETLHVSFTPVGVDDSHSVLVSGARRPDFPTDRDQMLLEMGANQIGFVIQRRHAEDQLHERQRRAQHSIRESEARKSAIMETALDCIISMDHEGKVLEFNPAAERTFGHRHADVVGRYLGDVIIPQRMRESHREGLARYIATGEERVLGRRFELSALHANGREFPVELAIMRIPADGPPVFTAYLRDISERKQAEDALRSSEARFRGLMEQAPFSIQIFSPDGRTIRVNQAWEELWGARLEDLQDYNVLEDPQLRRRGVLSYIQSGFSGEMTRIPVIEYNPTETLPIVAPEEDPRRWLSAVIYPLKDAAGEVREVVLVHEDITAKKLAEDELRIRLEQLAEAGRHKEELLASLRDNDRRKDEFLATLAHELRNPLAPVRNALQLLKMKRVDSETARRAVELMERQVHHLVRLVDDLLDVSRVMRGKIELRKETVELANIVTRAVETAQPLIEAQRHELEIDLSNESLLVAADPVRLSQVVSNLLLNAAKYTDAGGKITVSARVEDAEAVLRVRDDGIGIAAEMLPHVFDLFVQADHSTNRAEGGLGLGLTLVKNLVALHDGTVDLHSAGLGEGCEFTVRLPLLFAQSLPEGMSDPSEADAAPPGFRLLVVDDNEDAAVTLGLLLELRGHDVHVVHDGPTALEVVRDFRPDLVLLDLGMPGMDGFEVARRIRQTPCGGDPVLVALTGWGQPSDRRQTAEAGFDYHLVKPLQLEALHEILANIESSATE